jgi:hypothetical protein
MYSAPKSHVTSGTDHTDCKKRAWGHRMKCQVSVSVGVKLRRRALVLPQDGESRGESNQNHHSVFHRRFLRDLWASNTLAKNLRLRCAVAAAADPRCSP